MYTDKRGMAERKQKKTDTVLESGRRPYYSLKDILVYSSGSNEIVL